MLKNMYRKLKFGDVLFRFLPKYQVWHSGIVCKVYEHKCRDHNIIDCEKCTDEKYHISTEISVAEFDNENLIKIVSLGEYMFGRSYFWVYNYIDEFKDHVQWLKNLDNIKCEKCDELADKSKPRCIKCIICAACDRCKICHRPIKLFKNTKDIKRTIRKLMCDQPLNYTLKDYNCEYFTRRCTLMNQKIHRSPQTSELLHNNAVFATALVSLSIMSLFGKIKGDSGYEKKYRPKDVLYKYFQDGTYGFIDNKSNRMNADVVDKLASYRDI